MWVRDAYACVWLFMSVWAHLKDRGGCWVSMEHTQVIPSSPCLQRCCYRRTPPGPHFYVLGSWCLVKEFPYPLSHLSNPYKHIFPHQYSKELVTAGIPLFAWTNSNAISQFSTVDQFQGTCIIYDAFYVCAKLLYTQLVTPNSQCS